jgi:hypothetical protein
LTSNYILDMRFPLLYTKFIKEPRIPEYGLFGKLYNRSALNF